MFDVEVFFPRRTWNIRAALTCHKKTFYDFFLKNKKKTLSRTEIGKVSFLCLFGYVSQAHVVGIESLLPLAPGFDSLECLPFFFGGSKPSSRMYYKEYWLLFGLRNLNMVGKEKIILLDENLL